MKYRGQVSVKFFMQAYKGQVDRLNEKYLKYSPEMLRQAGTIRGCRPFGTRIRLIILLLFMAACTSWMFLTPSSLDLEKELRNSTQSEGYGKMERSRASWGHNGAKPGRKEEPAKPC